MRFVKFIAIAILPLLCPTGQAQALDQTSFGSIAPVLSYNPSTGQSSPFYPIGWYYYGPVTGFGIMQDMANSGCNTVLLSGLGTAPSWQYSTALQDLTWAQQLGMKVVIAIDNSLITGVNRSVPNSYSQLSWINDSNFTNNPALLGWQLGDELTGGSSADAWHVQDAAYLIKQWDPHHQLWQVSQAGISLSTIQAYMSGTNVYSTDYYDYFDSTGSFGAASNIASVFKTNAQYAANNNWAGNINVTQGVGCDVGTYASYRFPSAAEYRWNVFSNMAGLGARGTLNWVYYMGSDYYSNSVLFTNFRDQTVKPVMTEVRTIEHALETGWNVGTTSVNKGNLSQILLYDNSAADYFAVITNNVSSTQTFSLTISNLPQGLRDLVVLADTGGTTDQTLTLVNLGGGSYRLDTSLAGYGVGIYQLDAIFVPEPSSLVLLAAGLIGLLLVRLRQNLCRWYRSRQEGMPCVKAGII